MTSGEGTANTDSTTNIYSAEGNTNTFSQKNISRNSESLYISAVKKESEAKKYAYTVNDKVNNLVNITYTLTGREGYTFDTARFAEGSTLIEQLQDADYGYLTDREYVYFYDLLPPGVLYSYDASNPPKVGKLTSLTIDTDEDKQNSVAELNAYVDSMDSTYWQIIGEPETYRDWKRSGRMLVRFKVGLPTELKEAEKEAEKEAAQKLIYGTEDEKKWYLGLGIQFTAYVPWDRYATAQTQDNIFAYVTDTETYGIHAGNSSASGSVVYDDWTATSDAVRKTITIQENENTFNSYGHPVKTSKLEYDLFDGVTDMLNSSLSGLQTSTSTDSSKALYNRMFASANSLGLIADSSANGIRKQVRAEDDTYASYDSKTSVIAGHNYDYRITISESGSGVLGNILIYDMLDWDEFSSGENNTDKDHYNSSEHNVNWRGTIDSLQIQEIINMYGSRLQTLTKNNGTITGVTSCATSTDYGIEIYYTTEKYTGSGDGRYAASLQNADASKKLAYANVGVPADDVGNKWTKAESLSAFNAISDKSDITGIAVKLPDGFYLASGEILSITIKMKSPAYVKASDEGTYSMKYAQNKASYCYTEGIKYTLNGTNKTTFKENTGDSTYKKDSMPTLVSLGQLRKMYVKKEVMYSDDLEDNVKNSDFTFSVKQQLAIVDNSGKPESHLYDYAYREYKLYANPTPATGLENTVAADESYIIDNQKKYTRIADNIYMTDENGQFALQDGQLAYFEFIAGISLANDEKITGTEYVFDNFVVDEEASDT